MFKWCPSLGAFILFSHLKPHRLHCSLTSRWT
jgi:hypothetical protein